MESTMITFTTPLTTPVRLYETWPLMRLLELIGQTAGRDCLRELHDYRKPLVYRGRRCSVVDYIGELGGKKRAWEYAGRDPLVAEEAIALTVDKFLLSPAMTASRDAAANGAEDSRDGRGVDCRHYFRALVRRGEAVLSKRQGLTEFEEELVVERVFQRFVTEHMYLSCRECRRRLNKLNTRYAWETGGGRLTVWLPVAIEGKKRRKWLQEHVGEADPNCVGERERVQDLIDRCVGRKRVVSLSSLPETPHLRTPRPAIPPDMLAESVSAHGLTATLAREKADTLAYQRPSIRALGAENLAALVGKVFDALANGTYRQTELGRAFGLSKATMSRFAGSRWRTDDSAPIPDLFRNTASVLASVPDFRAAAVAVGVWPKVQDVVDRTPEGAQP